MRSVRIGHKLLGITVAAGLAMAGLVAYVVDDYARTLRERRSQEIVNLVEVGYTVLARFEQQARTGALPPEEAKARAIDVILSMRSAGSDYFWIYDDEPRMVAHSARPEMAGMALGQLRDGNGDRLFDRILPAVGAGGGKGFVEYVWPKAGSAEPVPKLSYFRRLDGWGWTLSTGMYLDDVNADINAAVATTALIAAVVLLGAAGSIAYGSRRVVVRPLGRLTAVTRTLTEGDRGVQVPYRDRGDELGDLARSLEVFRAGLAEVEGLRAAQDAERRAASEERRHAMDRLAREFEAEVGDAARAVMTASHGMSDTAAGMSENAEGTATRMHELVERTRRALENMDRVRSAADALDASIHELGARVARSEETSRDADAALADTGQAMQTLGTLVGTISDIADLISSIAGQTNLLALNATIEAARAGEAGKGFAVVAQEVKNLATQTAKATEDIARQIQGVTDATARAVGASDRVSGVVAELTDVLGSIAAAMEEQTAATRRIAANVREAADGTRAVTDHLGEVASAATETARSARGLETVSGDLGRTAADLRESAVRFAAHVRS